ncbi:MAG: leucyl aminopeptidase [Polaromonas sp.]|uniref:leucyl aminopeptidase n=1 Tax=Polaromonas sp. TaxID=1869339 RepID=UPI00271D54F3|nr:leucyl aminopeptidase [Polaromonas sp.]MDO9114376.1 leucyl aminopeptidase [Polaromonas sp.]MDP1885912.1 leucyl aminopeptidase [Polaromonas sp.]
MDFELKTLTPARICAEKCDALIVLVAGEMNAGTDAVSKMVTLALKAGDFENKAGKLLSAYRPEGVAATRVLLAGAGDGSAKSIRTAVHAAMVALKNTNARRVLLSLCALPQAGQETARAAVLACADAAYLYSTTKSKPAEQKLRQVLVAVSSLAASRAGFDKGVGLASGLALAKEWANRPANHATPTMLAQAARDLGKLPGIKVEVLGPKEVAKLGMGSFMAVAQGSEEPLRFIVLRYDGGAKTEAPVVLIGKGITFDTGGISIKPAAEMDEMKYDMGGAASVLGTFRALAELQPALNVVGLIPACENMPDGRAIKPGDVVTSMSGQTIEILNTDAEGRLVLCDALTYAERLKPRAVVDIATLTGACVIALGGVRSGMFSSDDALAQALGAAGDSSLDLCWRMPLDDEYAEGLKTHFADVANVAGRAGGAITAAKFLQRFAGKFPWAHLDIAGTAWKSGAAKGATGRPVPLLVDFLLSQVQPARAPAKTRTPKAGARSRA